jgi:diamine N-acetyltransferase
MNVTLKRIDASNFIDCFNLKLANGQEAFVSHPIRSLAQAYVYYNQCIPFGIYYEDFMVGYVMVLYDYDEEEYHIWHMMIDEKYQGKGYGKAAMHKCLEFIATKPFGNSNRVVLTCDEMNGKAIGLYRSLGFVPTGSVDEDEIELSLTI